MNAGDAIALPDGWDAVLVEKAAIPAWAHYKLATVAGRDCGTCDFFEDGRCEMFGSAPVRADMVCDKWAGRIDKADPVYEPSGAPKSSLALSTWTQDDIDRVGEMADRLEPKYPLGKGQARPTVLHLRVHGVSNAPGGMRVYRMASRDGHYVGRTLPTRVRARKGDVLKVETGDFLQDVQGDMRWVNPNVVSHYSDAPHSWRELSALAGGELAKDGAPGPAGDLPPAGDLGASSSMPSIPTLDALTSAANGPTLSDVHVNVPLPDISVSYVGEKKKRKRKADAEEDGSVLRGEFLPVAKADRWKQLALGVVLEPESLDSQDDYVTKKHVEKAAHAYMKRVIRGTASVSKLQHREQGFKKVGKGVIPVESFIAPTDFSYDGKDMIKAGSWVMVMHVEDDALWQDFLDGKYTGFSIGGTGIRRSVSRGNYEPEVPDGYMPQEPVDWSAPVAHPGYFTPVV